MKKFFLASMLFALSLGSATTLLAQDPNQITIKDPAEFNSYQNAITQTDPKAKASASESFLTQYPQSVVKKAVLDGLVDAYATFDPNKAVDAATRLLQVDSNNLKAMYIIVAIKKQQAGAAATANPAQQAQLLDDAAAMAQKGLAATKPADVKDEDFKKQKATTDPFFHSAIAYDDAISKKDYKAAITEFRTELEEDAAANPESTKSGSGLADTYQLADAYTKEDPKDMINAVWFFSRAADFAPPNYKAGIENNAKYWYKRYHGAPDGFEAVEAKAATSLFPTADFSITPAPTSADIAHKAVTDTPDLSQMPMGDKEFVIANGSKEDADKVWATIKDQTTTIPGLVIESSPTVIKLAVTDDAKQDKKADFTINMKTPLPDKDVPAVGATIPNLVGTFDSYTQTPAEIIMRDGEIPAEKKAPVHRKPTAAHKAPSK